MDLSEIRGEIDAIDRQLVPLLCRRLDCSLRVAAVKAENGLPVLDPRREQAVLRQVADESRRRDRDGAGYDRANTLVYSAVMDVSRGLQHRTLAAGRALFEELKSAPEELIEPKAAKIVCQGAKGAYSDEAASRLFPGGTPRFVATWRDVVGAVGSGEADYGLLPVENSSAGSVHEVYDLIIANRCRIAAACDLPVRHCLLTLPGADVRRVTKVVSHPQALAQCREYIRARGFAEQVFDNTATAARYVAALGDETVAAIGSVHAAGQYGLIPAEKNIQTVEGNRTRFVAIAQKLILPPNANRITLLFRLPHVTGSLYRTLARFALEGLNLTKIESRPLPGETFEYAFYLDLEGTLRSEGTLSLICALSEELPQFTLLGAYPEVSGQPESER